MLPSPLGVEVKRGWIGEAFYEVFQGVQMRDEIDVVEAKGSFIIYSHKFEFDVVGRRKKETKKTHPISILLSLAGNRETEMMAGLDTRSYTQCVR